MPTQLSEAYIAAIACHVPERRLTNAELQAENPDWDVDRIAAKTGIRERRIAAADETASDLGMAAAEKLLRALDIDRASVDWLIYCTQSPDYLLPTTACVLQARLGLATSCAAIDFNQGCSGYIYGLALAQSLVASGAARRVLLVTAETYSKFIHPRDRSVRVLFGDAATATLIDAAPGGARLVASTLGTDGRGAENLIVPAGGARRPACAQTKVEVTDDQGSTRTEEHLYMNGQELFLFTLQRVPEVVRQTLEKASLAKEDVNWFVFHQANEFMNEHLRTKLKVPKERAPLAVAELGNTVSNTIPIALCTAGNQFRRDDRVLMVGFGVGYSWGAMLAEWGDVKLFGPTATS